MTTLDILNIDPYLKPYEADLQARMTRLADAKKRLLKPGQDLEDFANGADWFGFQETKDGWYYREWAPNADSIQLVGDFNNWEGTDYEMTKDEKTGNWELFVPGKMPVGSRVKARITANGGETFDRIPTYIQYAVQDKETHAFSGEIYKSTYTFKHDNVVLDDVPLIYETHVGISTEEHKINSYKEFTRDVLPRIKAAGYNTIQMMAIMEHPLYASFGYQVSNFFAASSRFGTPDELKELIDTAHGMGLVVLLDVVHSHAVKNTAEGLNMFDGSDHQFFHAGAQGEHPAWNTKLFNYGKTEVLHFLLSNLKFWMSEFKFDGFRFDGVTSMLYHHHGLGTAFDNYKKYFSMDTDVDAVTYLQLANELIHHYNPNAVTIAEDMSAMPGMALPIAAGGIGFDYRLSMGVPDLWIKYLKEKTDDQWSMGQLWYELTTRRPGEKNIGYAESHDQALVGDKTLMMWLADSAIYDKMGINEESLVIDRAIALHKMIRLLTFSLAGEGYLDFMGNEFGHPEWLDFPREGNNDSYQHARRQWSLADRDDLKFKWLLAFDHDMIELENNEHFLLKADGKVQEKWLHEADKTLAFQKGNLLFAFNFNPSTAFDLNLAVDGTAKLVMDTDNGKFGGFGPRNSFTSDNKHVHVSLQPRTAMVFEITTK
jgi:1,4-alpha-glucan branching enzyme